MKIDNLEMLSAKEVTNPTLLLVSLVTIAFVWIVMGLCLIYSYLYDETIKTLTLGLLLIIGGIIISIVIFINRADLTHKYTEYTVIAVGQIDYEEFNKYYEVVYDSDNRDIPTIFKIKEKD